MLKHDRTPEEKELLKAMKAAHKAAEKPNVKQPIIKL
jgi:hypothetical protein